MIEVNISQGYVSAPIPDGIDLVTEIKKIEERKKMLSSWLITTRMALYKM